MNQKAIAIHEHNSARAAARILADRDSYPLAMVLVAEICQRRQQAEREEGGQYGCLVPSRATAIPERCERTKAATAATPMTQQALPLKGVSHAA